jgi:TPR repeat protein
MKHRSPYARLFAVAVCIALAGAVRLAAGGDPEADIRAGQYAKALAELLPAARAGDARSQYLLAALYANGNGVAQSTSDELQWLSKAAAQGYAPAQSDLGGLYLEGREVARDSRRAADLLQKAAAQGYAGAFYNLGVMARDGIGAAADPARARGFFLKAAESGDAAAQFNLARMFYEQRDFVQAVRWYEKAGNQGDIDALYNLGYMYHEGEGVARDYRKANELFLAVAKKGRFDEQRRGVKGCSMLGNSYRYGQGVPRDYVEAYKWYFLAAVQGHPDAPADMKAIEQFMSRDEIAAAKRRAAAFAKGGEGDG